MLEIQRVVYHWEGSINKILVDDKGLLVLCALGLPPMPHSDDPVRAVGTALDLVDNLKVREKKGEKKRKRKKNPFAYYLSFFVFFGCFFYYYYCQTVPGGRCACVGGH